MDQYNVHVGTQTFSGLYQFTTNTLLVETSQAIFGLGSDIFKGYLGSDFLSKYRITLPSNVTNLLTLARDEPSCRAMLDMPFRHFVLWAYPFGNGWPFDGYSSTEKADDYNELYGLTQYLLTNYNNSGKTFYLGHWEGDWYLLPNFNSNTNPSPVAIQGMIDWLNNRQLAIDDAKRQTAFTNVNVFCYAEVVRVRDAIVGTTNVNQRMINMVVPYVTNLDCLSWSSYDGMDLNSSDLTTTLNYIQSNLSTNKAAAVPGQRIWIGEYGWGGLSPLAQEPLNRSYIQRLLPWGPRFILFWEIYNNETNNNFCLIDSNDVKVPSYYLHQRFINTAKLLTARFKETNRRLPNDQEFASLLTPVLNQPLSPAINLSLVNGPAIRQGDNSVTVSGTLTQGIYGDDRASVSVFWGRTDGGTSLLAWEQTLKLGVNTNFNPTTFRTSVTNLVPQTNYFFRFYATNSSGEVWTPVSAQFTTLTLSPWDYGSRIQFTFPGYDRGEALPNFPVLISLGTNLPGFSYGQFASPTGDDIRFTDSDGTSVLVHEIDEWNTNGTSTVWVRVPELTATNNFIWGYWGNPSGILAPASTTNGQMWSSEHLLVWHLKESGLPYADSTQAHPALSGVAPSPVPGVVGHGVAFNGSSQFLNAGIVDLGDIFTLSAWLNISPAATDIQTIWANQKGGYASPGFAFFVDTYQTRDQKMDFASGDDLNGNESITAAGTVSFGQWHLLAAEVNRTNGVVEFFLDGIDVQSGSVITDFISQAELNLGRFTNSAFYFTGAMDEVRIQRGIACSNRLWASWLNVASNTAFVRYSSILRQPPILSIANSAGHVLFTWPASAVGFGLYTASNLVPPIAWAPVTNRPILSASGWQLMLSSDATPQFFRLQ